MRPSGTAYPRLWWHGAFEFVDRLALLGLVFEVFVSQEWISLLGLFPLINGIWGAYDLIKDMDGGRKAGKLQGGVMSFMDPMSRRLTTAVI